MTDAMLITSDSHGFPVPNGNHGHFVLRTSNPHLRVINQVTDGGHFPQSDCAVACTMTILLERGISVSGLTIERDEGTTAAGTIIDYIPPTLAQFGITSRIVNGEPAPGYIGNVAWGGLLDPSHFPEYLAAAIGRYVQVDDAHPTPPPPQEDNEMQQVIVVDKAGHYFQADGTHVRYLETTAEVADIEWVAANVFKKPVVVMNPVGDVLAYGNPANARTASILGVAFP